MKIAIRKEPNGSIYIAKNVLKRFDEESLKKPPYNYSFVEVENEDCEPIDFNDDLTFNFEKYNTRKQKEINQNKILELDNWFKTKYREYNEMLTRRKELGIEDVIVDEFRNKTYHNLIELYEEAEVVAKEIRELRK